MDETSVDQLLKSGEAATTLYRDTTGLCHLDVARRQFESLLELLLPQHPRLSACKSALAEVHLLLGKHTGEREHFDRALALAREAVEAPFPGETCTIDHQARLAAAYWQHAQQTNDEDGFNLSLRHFDDAIALAGDRHPQLALLLSERGAVVLELMEHKKEEHQQVEVVRIALSYHQKALKHPVKDEIDHATVLFNYAETAYRFSELVPGNSAMFEDALSSAKESIRLTPRSHHLYHSRWNRLGLLVHYRWGLAGPTRDEDFRILQECCIESLNSLPQDHRARNTVLLNLSGLLYGRYAEVGTLEDLDEAITLLKTLIGRLPCTHPHFPWRITQLATALVQSFRNRGLSTILDEAIAYNEQGRQHAPLGIKWRHDFNIGGILLERYAQQHNARDLDDAIKAFEDALEGGLLHRRYGVLASLGNALATRYAAQHSEDDLQRAIGYFDQILRDPTQQDTRIYPQVHDAYGLAILAKYRKYGHVNDLLKALHHFDGAISSVRDVHLSLGMYYSHCGIAQRLLFEHTQLYLHLDQSIDTLRHSTRATNSSHPLLSKHRIELARSLIMRSDAKSSLKDLVEASALLRAASLDDHGFIADRWTAARERASLLHDHHPDKSTALESYQQAISLLPRLAWLEFEEQARYQIAHQWLSLGNDAAACALAAGKTEIALECLENSRSVLWNQLFQLGHSHEALRRIDPGLADEMLAIGRVLEAVMGDTFAEADDKYDGRTRFEQAGRTRRHVAERWDDLVREVRQRFPGPGQFFGWPTYDGLREAAIEGPVVVLNISRYRCDGIIIPTEGPPVVVELHDARLDQVSLWARHYNTILAQGKDWDGLIFAEGQLSQLLDMLWRDIGRPICEALEPFRQDGRLPRVWLIPTGALAALPLHAAMSNGPTSHGIQDVLLPSYTPTLTALIRGRRALKEQPFKFLSVGCSTPSHKPLPAWSEEKASIQHLFSPLDLTVLENDEATREHVSQAIPSHSFVHLSCHGQHDWVNPYRSHLSLSDGDLTLRSIAHLKLEDAAFAFLSACHTARVDPRAPDEVVHLASGMNLAGFRSIIATMWGIADMDAPVVTEAVYSHMRRGGGVPKATDAAEALHRAVQQLRRNNVPIMRWAPFIHIGI